MITDEMIHGRIAAPRTRRIDQDTPIVPRAIAESVCEEVAVWLHEPLPRRWIRELTAQANTVYANNERFARQLRAAGDRGRDQLWVFMRHWLAARLWKQRRHLHARLPASFSIGHALPPSHRSLTN